MAIRRTINVRIPMRDGITLSGDLFAPDNDSPHDVILSRTPYNKNASQIGNVATSFAERGFCYLVVDVRGRGDSDGSFIPYINDGRDGYDAIEWAARQPWSSGRVATSGGSYNGLIQWLTALEQPPSLAAMMVAVTPSDPFVDWPTGIPSPTMLQWHALVTGRVLQYVDTIPWEEVYEHLPLRTMDEAGGFMSPRWREEVDHPLLDDFWQPLCYQRRLNEIDVPVLHISGWYDDVQVGTPRNYTVMRKSARREETRAAQRLLMGPWGHVINSERQLGEVDFGPQSLIDLIQYQLNWLAEVLDGAPQRVPPARVFLLGRNSWHDLKDWPPAAVKPKSLYLGSRGAANSRLGDGILTWTPPGPNEPPDTYTHDPMRPVPFITGRSSSQVGGPDDYSAVELRGDVLVYTGEVLTEPLTLAGPVQLFLHASSSAVDTDFTGKLLDVHPGGFVQRLIDGIVRARYRSGMTEETRLTPGEVYQFEIDLWNIFHTFLPGHRVRLEIASSAFPKYDRNLGNGELLATSVTPVIATNEVWHTETRPSRLVCPVIREADLDLERWGPGRTSVRPREVVAALKRRDPPRVFGDIGSDCRSRVPA